MLGIITDIIISLDIMIEIIIDHKIIAVAQFIGNEYQLFSCGKNHRKLLIRSLFLYPKLFKPVLGTVEFCLFLYYLTWWTGLIRNGSMLQTTFSINMLNSCLHVFFIFNCL